MTSGKIFIRMSDYSLMMLLYFLTINSKADCRNLQQDLHKPETWKKKIKLEFNPSKRQVLHITRARTPIRHQYVLHGQVLEAVDHSKYLGLEISHDSNCNTHVQNLTIKANRPLGFVRRNIQTKHLGIRQTAYNTLFGPSLSMPPMHGALRPRPISTSWKLSSAGQHAGS